MVIVLDFVSNDMTDPVEAANLRQKGNDLYLQKKFKESLVYYNSSMRNCTFGTQDYTRALGNKSAVLFEMGKYDKAASVIEFALPYVNSDQLKTKLVKRSTSCKREITECLSQNCCNQFNSNVLLDVVETDKCGGSVITKGRIEINDVIFQTRPYASVLGWAHLEEYCYSCFKYIFYSEIVPCPACSFISFCSLKCRDNNEVHSKYECLHISKMKETGVFHLVFHVFCQLHNEDSCSNMLPLDIFERDKPVFTDPDSSEKGIFQLYFIKEKRDQFMFESRPILEVISGILLMYFSQYNESQLNIILCTLASQMVMNASSIVHSDKERSLSSIIGSGIYPNIARLNHSCYSNTICLFDGNTLTMKATLAVLENEELFTSYGIGFETHFKSERQQTLMSQYCFHCDCLACKNDWIRDDSKRLVNCQNCQTSKAIIKSDEIRCDLCQSDLSMEIETIQSLETYYNEAFEYFQNAKYNKALQILTRTSLQQNLKFLCLPDSLLLDWNDLIRKTLTLTT